MLAPSPALSGVSGAAPAAPPDAHHDLNDEQRAVVQAAAAPLLVLAGAGSGKTRTLTHRAARLLAQPGPGGRGSRVLLMTFTQAAAQSMQERCAALLGRPLSVAQQLAPTAQAEPLLWAGTFHQIAARCLRCLGGRLGLSPDFKVLPEDDALALLTACLADSPARTQLPRTTRIAALLSRSVNQEAPLAQVLAAHAPELSPDLVPPLQALCDDYARRKLALSRLDFDDLLLLWRLLLCDVPAAAAELQTAFDHLLVDEYQDVSPLQAALVQALGAAHGSVTVVGDPGQAIYGFRGADPDQILRFPSLYQGAQVLRLAHNHRSRAPIVALANRVLKDGPLRLVPTTGDGPAPQKIVVADESEQARWVAERARALRQEDGVPLPQIAVLYRNHAHGRLLPAALAAAGLPSLVRSGPRDDDAAQQALALTPEPDVAPEAVTLSTVHRAKGLEWTAVFVLGLTDGSFPSLRPGSDLREERRLFYVAVTRARERLYLLAPRGGVAGAPLPPSRYLRELERAAAPTTSSPL